MRDEGELINPGSKGISGDRDDGEAGRHLDDGIQTFRTASGLFVKKMLVELFALTDLSWLYKREERVYVDLPRAPFKQFKKPHSPP